MWETSRNKLKKHSVTRNCSDLSLFEKINQVIFFFFANSRPSSSNFKSFSRSLEQIFLTVGQDNVGNKIPYLQACLMFYQWKQSSSLQPLCKLGLKNRLTFSICMAGKGIDVTYWQALWINGPNGVRIMNC